MWSDLNFGALDIRDITCFMLHMQPARFLYQTTIRIHARSPIPTSLCHYKSYLGTSTIYQTRTMASATSFFDFKPKDSKFFPVTCYSSPLSASPLTCLTCIEKGNEYPLAPLNNKVILIVNTASKCGFTPQFDGLEKLYKDLQTTHPDFIILGFPCNQFGGQDPGSNEEIQEFCQINYGVSFPMLGKIDVNGEKAEPLWEWLKSERPGLMGLKRVKWNFEKFLIGRDGKVKGRWASTTKPESLKEAIEKELAAKPTEA